MKVPVRCLKFGTVPVGMSPQDLAAYQSAEQDEWGQVIQRADSKPDYDPARRSITVLPVGGGILDP